MNIPYINNKLAGAPLNWAIVGAVATIWLLAFHVIMQGYGAMSGNGTNMAPGTASSPLVGGNSAGPVGLGESLWTDGIESRYSEDDGLSFNGAYY